MKLLFSSLPSLPPPPHIPTATFLPVNPFEGMYVLLPGVLRLSSGPLFTLLSHLLQRHAPALCSGWSATMEFSNVWKLSRNKLHPLKQTFLFIFTFSFPFGIEIVLLSFTALRTGEVCYLCAQDCLASTPAWLCLQGARLPAASLPHISVFNFH